jgi:hypothetical protein
MRRAIKPNAFTNEGMVSDGGFQHRTVVIAGKITQGSVASP